MWFYRCLKIVTQKHMMDKYEWGKCRLNVVTFRLHTDRVCVSLWAFSKLLFPTYASICFFLYLSHPSFPLFFLFSFLCITLNSHSAMHMSPHLCPFHPAPTQFCLFPLSRFLSTVLSSALFSVLLPFCFPSWLFHHKLESVPGMLCCSLAAWCGDDPNLHESRMKDAEAE